MTSFLQRNIVLAFTLTTLCLSASATGSRRSGDNGSRASDSDVQTYLETHNSIRSKHGAVDVTWSNDAAGKAQQWADECKNVHSGGTLGPLGENLAAGTGNFSITDAVKAWTDEVSEYNPKSPQPSHFTQVVWKATHQIGCAVQICDGIFPGFGPAQYYVCEYSVQGNVIGNFGANVQTSMAFTALPLDWRTLLSVSLLFIAFPYLLPPCTL